MTPSRLGSRGRPPRLGRGISVVLRTAMRLTLDTKDRNVPELRSRGTVSHPEEAIFGRAPVRKLGKRQSSCGCGNDMRWGVQLPAELGGARLRDPGPDRHLDRTRAAERRAHRDSAGSDGPVLTTS